MTMTIEPTQNVLARRDAFVAARDIYITATLLEKLNFWLGPSTGDHVPYRRDRPVFVQYANPEILACYGWRVGGRHSKYLLAHALNATRLAILLTEKYIIIPASYIFEVPWFHVFLREISPLLHEGYICYTSPVPELSVYQDLKAAEYRFDNPSPYGRVELDRIYRDVNLTWLPRNSKATAADISSLWRNAMSPGGDLSTIRPAVSKTWRRSYGRLDKTLFEVPERLEGQAFIRRFVRRVIPAELPAPEDSNLAFFLSRSYLRSYLIDFDASLVTDLPAGELSCGLNKGDTEMSGRLLSARRLRTALGWLKIDDFVYTGAAWFELMRLAATADFGFIMSVLFGRGSTAALRFATMRAARSTRFQNAFNYSTASRNLQLAAAEITKLIE